MSATAGDGNNNRLVKFQQIGQECNVFIPKDRVTVDT